MNSVRSVTEIKTQSTKNTLNLPKSIPLMMMYSHSSSANTSGRAYNTAKHKDIISFTTTLLGLFTFFTGYTNWHEIFKTYSDETIYSGKNFSIYSPFCREFFVIRCLSDIPTDEILCQNLAASRKHPKRVFSLESQKRYWAPPLSDIHVYLLLLEINNLNAFN